MSWIPKSTTSWKAIIQRPQKVLLRGRSSSNASRVGAIARHSIPAQSRTRDNYSYVSSEGTANLWRKTAYFHSSQYFEHPPRFPPYPLRPPPVNLAGFMCSYKGEHISKPTANACASACILFLRCFTLLQAVQPMNKLETTHTLVEKTYRAQFLVLMKNYSPWQDCRNHLRSRGPHSGVRRSCTSPLSMMYLVIVQSPIKRRRCIPGQNVIYFT